MITYTINGKPFEFDETKTYLDFYLVEGEPFVVTVPFGITLEALATGALGFGRVENDMVMLDRWVEEAPRKRFYRGLILEGVHVLTQEFFFHDRADGEEIINSLENTGHVARRILEALAPALAFACKTQKPHPASVLYKEL